VSWILYAIAAICGNWERFDGIPEAYKRYISVGVAFLVFLGSLIITCLTNWMHQAIVASLPPPYVFNFVYKGTFGLWSICYYVMVSGIENQTTCTTWSSVINIIVAPGYPPFPAGIPSKPLNEVRASQAFCILATITSLATFISVFVGFWQRDDSGPIAKLRLPLMGVTSLWLFLSVCMWADLSKLGNQNDMEYGGAFAMNIFTLIIAVLWALSAYFKGSGATDLSGGSKGFGYAVVTTDTTV